jgi:hypothetical protein
VVARKSLGLPACTRRVGPKDAAASLQVGGSEPVQWVRCIWYLCAVGVWSTAPWAKVLCSASSTAPRTILYQRAEEGPASPRARLWC